MPSREVRRNSGPQPVGAAGGAVDAREAQPGLEGRDRAGGGHRAAADLDLAPAGLAAQGQQQALRHDPGPAGAPAGPVAALRVEVLAAAVEPGDLGAAQPAGKAHQKHRPVAQPPKVVGQGGEHCADVLGRERVLADRRPGVATADAGEDGGDVPVLPVEAVAGLRAGPGDAREPPLDGGDREAAAAALRGGEVGDVEADHLRRGRQRLRPVQAAPARVLRPVRRIGPRGVGGDRAGRVVPRARREPVERAGAGQGEAAAAVGGGHGQRGRSLGPLGPRAAGHGRSGQGGDGGAALGVVGARGGGLAVGIPGEGLRAGVVGVAGVGHGAERLDVQGQGRGGAGCIDQ